MAKRLRLHEMRRHDRDNDTCYVRLIEMDVDAICIDVGHPGYSQQFWRDVQLYGLRESFSMLRRFTLEQSGDPNLPRRLDELNCQVSVAEAALDSAY